jgi:hypothetical protein
LSRKLRIRAEEVAHLLRIRGCVLTRDVVAMGFTPSQARHTLKYLASAGCAAHVNIGGVSMWCYSRHSVARHIHRLRRALHEALCRAYVRYTTPRRAVKILLSDEKARRIFSRYVALSPKDTAVKRLVGGLLALTYDVVASSKRRRVYAVDCGR